jgi:integrase
MPPQCAFEDAECKKLIASSRDEWFKAIVKMGRTYRWRISELLNLKAGQIDIAARTIRLEPGTKNKGGREATMTGSINILLTQCVAGKSAESSALTRHGGKPAREFFATLSLLLYSGCADISNSRQGSSVLQGLGRRCSRHLPPCLCPHFRRMGLPNGISIAKRLEMHRL